MDFELDFAKGLEEFQQEVRQLFEENIPKNGPRATANQPYTRDEYLWRRELGRKLGERGWLFPTYPKEYGGGGLSVDHAFVIAGEAHRQGLMFHRMCISTVHNSGATVSAPCLVIWANEEQKQEFLVPMLTGQAVTWQLLTEPQGGSDIASTITRAVRDGDEYVINGQKTFVGGPYDVDYFWTLVNTDPSAPRHQNLSYLMIPANLPGITIHPLDLCTADETRQNNSVFFDNVRVPTICLIGGENEGWKVAATHMEYEHGGAGNPVEVSPALDEFFEYCRTTEYRGKPLSHDPEIRDILADIRVEAQVSRLLQLRNFWNAYAREPMSYEGSQAYYQRRMATLRNARRIQEILGYPAVISDSSWTPGDGEIELLVRHGFGGLHGGGTHDTDRVIVARRMGLGRSVQEEAGQIVSS